MNHNATQLQIVCGTGGVGKTTLAAALALKHALLGKKSVVITIDPAKRLADALGIKKLSDAPQKIFTNTNNGGATYAFMLEPKSTFDRLIHKYAPSPAVAEKILQNSIYQNLSSMISGSQEYMAMEMIFEIWDSGEFEVIVVDTPPLQNAIDFLLAPQKMVDLLRDSLLQHLLKPSLAQGAAQGILKMFDKIIGFEFLKNVAELVVSFQDLLSGFEARAAQIREVFKSKKCDFILVASPQVTAFEDVQNFAKTLNEMDYNLSAILVNRFFAGKVLSTAQITQDKTALAQIFKSSEAEFLVQNFQEHLPLIKQSDSFKTKIQKTLPKLKLNTILFEATDVHDLAMLVRIAKTL